MESTYHMAKRFREVILNGTWIANTNYSDQLTDLNFEIAVAKVGSLNTIALLAQHIHYYVCGINNVFEGGGLDIKDKYSFDFAPIESKDQWEEFLNIFWNDAEKFASLIEKMPGEKLNEEFVEEKYNTYRRNIEAMIEHSYYHLGQIVLLRKILTDSASSAANQ